MCNGIWYKKQAWFNVATADTWQTVDNIAIVLPPSSVLTVIASGQWYHGYCAEICVYKNSLTDSNMIGHNSSDSHGYGSLTVSGSTYNDSTDPVTVYIGVKWSNTGNNRVNVLYNIC